MSEEKLSELEQEMEAFEADPNSRLIRNIPSGFRLLHERTSELEAKVEAVQFELAQLHDLLNAFESTVKDFVRAK
jgi:hypothetical protein